MQGEKSKSVRKGVIIGIGSVMNGQMTGTINVLAGNPANLCAMLFFGLPSGSARLATGLLTRCAFPGNTLRFYGAFYM